LVQGFGSFPTQISRFLGLREVYGQTVPATDQLWPGGFLHIKEDVKLHILSSGWLFLMRSDQVGAGLCEFSHRNFEVLGDRMTHGSRYRLAMARGVLVY